MVNMAMKVDLQKFVIARSAQTSVMRSRISRALDRIGVLGRAHRHLACTLNPNSCTIGGIRVALSAQR